MTKFVYSLLCFTTVVSLIIRRSEAANVSLGWNRNVETDLAGYKVYYGVPNSKMVSRDVGLTTTTVVSNLTAGTTYSFYATAYNTSGLESTASASILYTVPSGTLDSDGDGIPDSYEIANGLNPYSNDTASDADGDGMTNAQEYFAGTNPSDPTSVLQITSVVDRTPAVAVSFQSTAGKIYTIEANNSFPTGPWITVTTITGTGATIEVVDGQWSGDTRIYHVKTKGPANEIVFSQPAGIQRMSFAGNSDTMASAPLLRPAAFVGTVAASSENLLQAKGANWRASQFAYRLGVQTNSYFVLIRSGALEGALYNITGNSADTLSLDLQSQSLANLKPGDSISIVPHWTLGTMFPGGRGVNPSPSQANRRTELLMPKLVGDVNSTATKTYYYWNDEWRAVGEGITIKNDDVILPDMYIWVRQNVSTTTDLTLAGTVVPTKWRFDIQRNAAKRLENVFSVPRPTPVSLKDLGLMNNNAFLASTSQSARTDELLVFDNDAIGEDKAASATYYYWNGAWRKVGAGSTDVGNDIISKPGTGFIIRTGVSPTSSIWVNQPGY